MIKDSRINASVGCTVAYGAWALAVAFVVATWVTDDRRFAATGLLLAGIAVTATVRGYFVDFSEMVRRAFEADEEVTPLHR